MQRLRSLISRFRKDERGVFIVIFAILGVVLIASSGAVVDFTKMQQARTRAQTALDAGTLALQAQINTLTNEELRVRAEDILKERLDDNSITAVVDSASKNITEGKLTVEAHIVVPTAFVQLVGINTITARLLSEVTRASSNLEVSVALDITQSMSGNKVTALKGATNNLIDALVKDVQTPTYSKMALAPYSMAVNVGSYADKARGAEVGGTTISSVAWANGTAKTIQAISKANPAVITFSSAQTFVAGDYVYITSITGMTQISTGIYRVGTVNAAKTTFQLKTQANANVNSTNYSNYTANSGRVTKCLNADCKLTVTTSSNHGHANGDYTYITGSAASGLNSLAWAVSGKTNTTYIAEGSDPADGSGNGGTSWCTKYGCTYYRYQTISGTYNVYKANQCVVERPTTTQAYTDKNPTDAPVGFHYTATGSACLGQQIVPLTSNKQTLHNLANSLSVAGSTAGQIGLAWAWYMVSPNFISKNIGTAWPAASKPAAYGEEKLIKAVILMTDGVFNTIYDRGVPSRDSDSVSGNNNVRSTNNSPLNGSIQQATAICTEIKKPANKTLLYTVGFDIASNSTEDKDARAFLKACATEDGFFYQADDAADLDNAFQSIADSLSELRISK